MIIFNRITDIDDKLFDKLNNFILLFFPESRLYTYESFIYSIDNNEITGFVGINIYGNTILLSQLCVNIIKRNQGLATSLLTYIEQNFNIKYIVLYIRNHIDMSITEKLYNFYTKRGFNEIYKDVYKIKMCKII